MIGALIAVMSAVNHFLSPLEIAAGHKRDELKLRAAGWKFLGPVESADQLSAELVSKAYDDFNKDASKILDEHHRLSFGPGAQIGD
ncbi:MAG: hypothetical protein ABSG43_26515 [Solirubrobacteraceae bacterium]|jgi:hypothetical protein